MQNTTANFDESLLSQLDDAQRMGVMSGPGLTPITAGAGTGKTRVLTTRIVRLVQQGILPERISAVTFTKKAAREMRERAIAMGGQVVASVRFGTLHALAAGIVRRHWEAAGLTSPDFLIADDDDIKAILHEAVLEVGALDAGAANDERELAAMKRETVKFCSRYISGWKENGLRISDVQDAKRYRRSDGEEVAASVYVAYQNGLVSRNMVDFADLNLLAVAVLESSIEILDEEAARIEWLMVDEFQDTNPIQLRLLYLLTSRGANVTVVGDDDQSIYSFRRAVPNLMERAAEFFPGVALRGLNKVSLVTNRRCTDDILGPANLLVDYNRREEPKVLRSGRSGSPVTVSGHPGEEAESNDVASRVASLIADGTPPGEIAILSRVGDVLTNISASLARLRVPHSVQAGTSFLERSEVMDIMAYLKLAIDPDNDLSFRRIHARPTRGIGVTAAEEVVAIARQRGIPFHDALLILADTRTGLKAEARAGAERLSSHLIALADACRMAESSEAMVRYVLDDVGYSNWAWSQSEPPKTLRKSIEQIIENARAQPDFYEFMIDCSLMGTIEERAEGTVHLGTLHGSKGLEWDAVFLVAFEEGIIPNQRALDDADDANDDSPWSIASRGGMEEERRLAHVGLTRARHSAHISFSVMRRRNGKLQPSKPSRLLREAELDVPRVTQTFTSAKDGRKKVPAKRSFF